MATECNSRTPLFVVEVENKIGELGHADPFRLPERITQLVIHRCGVGKDAAEIAEFYQDNPEYTGGKMPYHLVVHPNGRIEQCVELGTVAPGALRLNRSGIQIACIGDFREEPPAVKQSMALIEICTMLSEWVNKVAIVGHTDEAGASIDPDKVCPGKHLPTKNLQSLVESRYTETTPLEAERALLNAGVVI
jgi:N-acetyl-anhydromuramyl-L-alanine amidase AmpD